tara:strand:+ start:6238 stop:6420 length:183 start_codon:yes stop_codon:yes gene_type:complete
MFKKEKIIPKKPDVKKKKRYFHKNRHVIERKKSRLQIRTGKDLKIIPIQYKEKFKNVHPI